MANLDQMIKKRKSSRTYSEKRVKDSDIDTILEAGTLAPSSLNIQPWKFIVVRNKDKINHLMSMCYYALKGNSMPSAVIAVVVDKEALPEKKLLADFQKKFIPNLHFLNVAMPALNMTYQANSMGISSVIKSPMVEEAGKALNIPEGHECALLVCLGSPVKKEEDTKLFRVRKSFQELTFYEKFGNK